MKKLAILSVIASAWLSPLIGHAQVDNDGKWKSESVPTLRYHGPVGVAESERHTVSSGKHHFTCYATDDGGSWKPRSEVSWNPDYGLTRQFQATYKVVKGTNNWCIWQIHTSNSQTATNPHTTGMIWYRSADNGSLYWYGSGPFATGLDDKNFTLNVIHDVGTDKIKIYVNGTLKATKDSNAPNATLFYLQFGVYAQNGASSKGECYISSIKRWKR